MKFLIPILLLVCSVAKAQTTQTLVFPTIKSLADKVKSDSIVHANRIARVEARVTTLEAQAKTFMAFIVDRNASDISADSVFKAVRDSAVAVRKRLEEAYNAAIAYTSNRYNRSVADNAPLQLQLDTLKKADTVNKQNILQLAVWAGVTDKKLSDISTTLSKPVTSYTDEDFKTLQFLVNKLAARFDAAISTIKSLQ